MKSTFLGKRGRNLPYEHQSGDDDSTHANNSSRANNSQQHKSEPVSDSEGFNEKRKEAETHASQVCLKRKTMEVVKCPHKN